MARGALALLAAGLATMRCESGGLRPDPFGGHAGGVRGHPSAACSDPSSQLYGDSDPAEPGTTVQLQLGGASRCRAQSWLTEGGRNVTAYDLCNTPCSGNMQQYHRLLDSATRVPLFIKFHKVAGTELRRCLGKALRYIRKAAPGLQAQLRSLGCDPAGRHCGMPAEVRPFGHINDECMQCCGWDYLKASCVPPSHRAPIVILRDPLEQMLSSFFFRMQDIDSQYSLAAVAKHGYPGGWAVDFEADLAINGSGYCAPHSSLRRLYTIKVRSSNSRSLDNWTIGQPCTAAECTPRWTDIVEAAVKQLDRFAVVGLTERFLETLTVISHVLGWPIKAFEQCGATQGHGKRTQTNRPDTTDIPAGLREKIMANPLFQAEQVLYRAASARLRRLVGRVPDFRRKLEVLTRHAMTEVSPPRQKSTPRGTQVDSGHGRSFQEGPGLY
mmetsp:Transcript_24541/g.73551  ORF Transcript_24541/g.73551 Transcript_24541/m.73551 type:complete len:441 (-) Transcript_24541:741-2063(-)